MSKNLAPAPNAIEAGREIKNALDIKGGRLAEIAAKLDGWAIQLGTREISVLDVVLVIAVFIAVWLLARVLNGIARRLLRRVTSFDATQLLLAEKLTAITIWTFAILVGIDFLGIDLTAFAVFSGAFGLAIGFGLQKTFGNLIAGIILLMDRSIKPGDVIAISDASGQGTYGQIRKIGIRAVSITTRDQKEYLIPNENLMINQVENWSYSNRNVRIQIPVGVSYSSDMDLVERLLLQACTKSERILTDPAPSVWMVGFGPSSVDFAIQAWISDPEEGVKNVKSEILKEIWHSFKAHQIDIPFPQHDVNLRSNAEFEKLLAVMAATKS